MKSSRPRARAALIIAIATICNLLPQISAPASDLSTTLSSPLSESATGPGATVHVEDLSVFEPSGGTVVIDPETAEEETLTYSGVAVDTNELLGLDRQQPTSHEVGAVIEKAVGSTTSEPTPSQAPQATPSPSPSEETADHQPSSDGAAQPQPESAEAVEQEVCDPTRSVCLVVPADVGDPTDCSGTGSLVCELVEDPPPIDTTPCDGSPTSLVCDLVQDPPPVDTTPCDDAPAATICGVLDDLISNPPPIDTTPCDDPPLATICGVADDLINDPPTVDPVEMVCGDEALIPCVEQVIPPLGDPCDNSLLRLLCETQIPPDLPAACDGSLVGQLICDPVDPREMICGDEALIPCVEKYVDPVEDLIPPCTPDPVTCIPDTPCTPDVLECVPPIPDECSYLGDLFPCGPLPEVPDQCDLDPDCNVVPPLPCSGVNCVPPIPCSDPSCGPPVPCSDLSCVPPQPCSGLDCVPPPPAGIPCSADPVACVPGGVPLPIGCALDPSGCIPGGVPVPVDCVTGILGCIPFDKPCLICDNEDAPDLAEPMDACEDLIEGKCESDAQLELLASASDCTREKMTDDDTSYYWWVHRGTSGNDICYGTNQRDIFWMGGGNDVARAYDGNDEMHMSEGNDRAYGVSGADVIYGGGGSDVLVGGYGNDIIHDGLQPDRWPDYDSLYGGPGTDDFNIKDGDPFDEVWGGRGYDPYPAEIDCVYDGAGGQDCDDFEEMEGQGSWGCEETPNCLLLILPDAPSDASESSAAGPTSTLVLSAGNTAAVLNLLE